MGKNCASTDCRIATGSSTHLRNSNVNNDASTCQSERSRRRSRAASTSQRSTHALVNVRLSAAMRRPAISKMAQAYRCRSRYCQTQHDEHKFQELIRKWRWRGLHYSTAYRVQCSVCKLHFLGQQHGAARSRSSDPALIRCHFQTFEE